MERPYKSGIADQLQEFTDYKKATGRWSAGSEDNLHCFDNYCAKHYPKNTVLTEDMLEWCKEKPTEHGNSCSCRMSIVREFIRYLRKMGRTTLELPTPPLYKPCTYIPHTYTEDEKKQFFIECDRYSLKIGSSVGLSGRKKSLRGRKIAYINQITIPIIFRLMYSNGLRTKELLRLRCTDVDFEQGIININESKGNDKHRVALHKSMLDLLKQFDDAISSVVQSRTFFFSKLNGESHGQCWFSGHFRNIWKAMGKGQAARAYDWRNNYAIENISKWTNVGYEITNNLISLGRSMGHVKVSSTMRYFHLSPCFAHKMRVLSEDNFNNLLPGYYDEQK
jgi:integrase